MYTPTVSGNTFTYTYTASGLDYRKTYSVYAHVRDELVTIYNGSFTLSSTPVFDWGEDEFNVNVPIAMNEDIVLRRDNANTVLAANSGKVYIRPNGDTNTTGEAVISSDGKLYVNGIIHSTAQMVSNTYVWAKGDTYVDGALHMKLDGYYNDVGVQTDLKTGINKYMHGTQSFTLSGDAALSRQINGYIMVWSYFSGGTTYVNCTNYTFVPKSVLGYNGGRITMPIALDDGTCGAKSLIITESGGTTTIQGEERNDDAPNNNWVLNKVIGY